MTAIKNNKCNCGCDRLIKPQFHHKYYGIPKYIPGHNKPWKGKHIYEFMKLHLSRFWTGKIRGPYKKQIIKNCIYCKNIMVLPPSMSTKKFCNNQCYLNHVKVYGLSKKARENMSKSQIEHYMEYGINNGSRPYLRSGKFYSNKNTKEIHYDSLLELKFFKLLETMSHVIMYKRCNFFIEYKFDNITRRYNPDLFIEYDCGSNEIIEIKPFYLTTRAQNCAKFEAGIAYAKRNDIAFSIWTEKDL